MDALVMLSMSVCLWPFLSVMEKILLLALIALWKILVFWSPFFSHCILYFVSKIDLLPCLIYCIPLPMLLPYQTKKSFLDLFEFLLSFSAWFSVSKNLSLFSSFKNLFCLVNLQSSWYIFLPSIIGTQLAFTLSLKSSCQL